MGSKEKHLFSKIGKKVLLNSLNYFRACSTATATATVMPTMWLLPAPRKPIISLEVPRLARSTKQLCEIIELVKSKSLRLMIVGSITLDFREGHADPMSEAFLQMAGGIEPVGTCDDTSQSKKRYGERKSEGGQNRQTAINGR